MKKKPKRKVPALLRMPGRDEKAIEVEHPPPMTMRVPVAMKGGFGIVEVAVTHDPNRPGFLVYE